MKAKNCAFAFDEKSGFFIYRYGWVVGVGRYIGQTKGVMFTRDEADCPTGLRGWRYLNEDLAWQDNGNIYIKCAS